MSAVTITEDPERQMQPNIHDKKYYRKDSLICVYVSFTKSQIISHHASATVT